MQSLIQITLIGFATLCAAQFQNLPDCAKPCASNLPAQCHLDVSCICSDSAWISGISCCIKTACSPSDQQKTLNVAVQLCDTVNVNLPSAASCPASATASASSTIAGGSTVAGGTTASSSISAATAGTVGSAEATSPSSTPGASTTTSTSATGSSSTTASTSSSATQATGAAQVLGSNMGAVGAAVAALALL